MLFRSEHQLIFKVKVGNTERLVRFSDPNANSSDSSFVTEDKAVINAIRRHKFFQTGKIKAYGVFPEDDSQQQAQVPAPSIEEQEPYRKPLIKPSVTPSKPVAAQPKPTPATQSEGKVLMFANFSQMKNYLKKEYKAEANSVRSLKDAEEFARKKGISFKYEKK